MKIKYCLPIIKHTKEQVLKIIDENKQEYQYFEIWIDYIADIDDAFIECLADNFQKKIIFLFRRLQLEQIHMDLQRRKEILNKINNTSVCIDLDITTQQEELDYVRENKLAMKTIVSYHNYEETPRQEILEEYIKQMKQYNPTIYKIATMCKTEKDGLQLLQLLLSFKQQDKKVIVLGMGEKGIVTRIFGTLWGNEMTFAPKERIESSASGQIIKQDLQTIFSILNT